MTAVITRIRVAPDHTISGLAPPDVPPGEHEVMITITRQPNRRVSNLPVRHGRWDDSISLHREDLYIDDGR